MSDVVYRINRPEVIDEHFDDECVIVNLKTGAYYSLNPSGAVIWDALGRGATRAEILQTLFNSYQDEPAALEQHAEKLLNEMADEALIVIEPASSNDDTARTRAPEANAPRPNFIPPLLEKYTDMQALLLLDPIHQVDDSGWPAKPPDAR